MQSNRRLWIVLALIVFLLAAFIGFYLWLTGGQQSPEQAPDASEGLIPVKSIYFYDTDQPLGHPVGIGADGTGGFFVTLRDGTTVVEFDRNGTYVRHFGERGMTPGSLLTPLGVAVDRLAAHVYVVDRARLRILCFDTAGEFLWEIPFLSPLSVTVGPDGTVYAASFASFARYSSEGEFIDESGSRGAQTGQFDFPRQIVVADDETVFVADSNNARVQRVTPSAAPRANVDWVVGEPLRNAEDATARFQNPTGIALSPRGPVVVLDAFRHKIEMLDPDTGDSLTDFGGERRGSGDGMFNMPSCITHLYGDTYAITDTFNDRVQIVRLIEPDRRNPFVLYPWLKWLFLLLLLPLLALFRRRRVFLTRESVARAVDEGTVRLFAGAFRRLHVLPEVAEEFASHMEGEVRIADYFVVVEPHEQGQEASSPDTADAVTTPVVEDSGHAAEKLLAATSARTRTQRLLLARHHVIGVDAEQCGRLEELGCQVLPYEQVLEEYALEE